MQKLREPGTKTDKENSKTKYNNGAKFKSKMQNSKPKHTTRRLETEGVLGGHDADRSRSMSRSRNRD